MIKRKAIGLLLPLRGWDGGGGRDDSFESIALFGEMYFSLFFRPLYECYVVIIGLKLRGRRVTENTEISRFCPFLRQHSRANSSPTGVHVHGLRATSDGDRAVQSWQCHGRLT